MNRYILPLNAPNAVTAGQRSAFALPTDARYHSVNFNYKTNANQATIEADIEYIELKVKGRVRRFFTPAELFAINAEMGQPFVAGLLPIFFSEPNARSSGDEDILAWGMSDVNNFEVYVKIASGAVSPTLTGWAEVDEVQEPFQGVVEWISGTVDVTATGVKKFTPQIEPSREILKALHLFEGSAGDITNVTVRLDRLEVYNANIATNTQALARNGFTAQSGVFSFRPDRHRRLENLLPLVKANNTKVNSFIVEATMANATSFTYQEQVFIAFPI